jgi:hypothetical protein
MTVVYAETNFILELAYLQEQHASCEHLLALAESGQIRLAIPAFSLMEAQSAFASRSLLRDRAREALAQPVREIGRSLPYKFAGEASWRIIIALLSKTTREEGDRLKAVLDRILGSAELIPLETTVLKEIDTYGQQSLLSGCKSKKCNWLHVDSSDIRNIAGENSSESAIFSNRLTLRICNIVWAFDTRGDMRRGGLASMLDFSWSRTFTQFKSFLRRWPRKTHRRNGLQEPVISLTGQQWTTIQAAARGCGGVRGGDESPGTHRPCGQLLPEPEREGLRQRGDSGRLATARMPADRPLRPGARVHPEPAVALA